MPKIFVHAESGSWRPPAVTTVIWTRDLDLLRQAVDQLSRLKEKTEGTLGNAVQLLKRYLYCRRQSQK